MLKNLFFNLSTKFNPLHLDGVCGRQTNIYLIKLGMTLSLTKLLTKIDLRDIET